MTSASVTRAQPRSEASKRDRSRKFIGSARFGSEIQFPGSTRFDLRFSAASWLGPVRFGSFPRPVPAGSSMKRFGSFRFGSAGSVRSLTPY